MTDLCGFNSKLPMIPAFVIKFMRLCKNGTHRAKYNEVNHFHFHLVRGTFTRPAIRYGRVPFFDH